MANPAPDSRLLLLEAELTKAEHALGDVIDGAEKHIEWAIGPGMRTEYAIVYLHGFSATRQELAPVTTQVAQSMGSNVFYTRLSGHGRDAKALENASAQDWYADVKRAYKIGRDLGDKVILVGVSTGATLATWLIAEGAISPDALVFISPNFELAEKSIYLLDWPLGPSIARFIRGPQYSFEPISEAHAKYWTTSYSYESLLEMLHVVKKVKQVNKGLIEIPLLTIYSPRDQVVDPEATRSFFNEYGGEHKQLIEFHEAESPWQHLLGGDIVSPGSSSALAEKIQKFLQQLYRKTEA